MTAAEQTDLTTPVSGPRENGTCCIFLGPVSNAGDATLNVVLLFGRAFCDLFEELYLLQDHKQLLFSSRSFTV